ncbi:MAG TPA: hypothetical protein VH307_05750, partial [Streptosporangiaceae bacterium]|nr:hypothetical protein [Streptosporangiaceae bacterium]
MPQLLPLTRWYTAAGYLRRLPPEGGPPDSAAYSGVVPVLGGGDPQFRDDDGCADPRAVAAL